MNNKLNRANLLETFVIYLLPSASNCSRAKMPHTKGFAWSALICIGSLSLPVRGGPTILEEQSLAYA
jgi:hypothetical protein